MTKETIIEYSCLMACRNTIYEGDEPLIPEPLDGFGTADLLSVELTDNRGPSPVVKTGIVDKDGVVSGDLSLREMLNTWVVFSRADKTVPKAQPSG